MILTKIVEAKAVMVSAQGERFSAEMLCPRGEGECPEVEGYIHCRWNSDRMELLLLFLIER
jgi:hypothetical protein